MVALVAFSFVARDVAATEIAVASRAGVFAVALAADVEVSLQKALLASVRTEAGPAVVAGASRAIAQGADVQLPDRSPQAPAPTPSAPRIGEYLGEFKVTCYALQGITFSGAPVAQDSIATDPDVIPMGARVYVDGLGWKVARDTGGLIIDKVIDIWNPSYDWCIQWGVQYIDVWAEAPEPTP